jgi:hypothetical protein
MEPHQFSYKRLIAQTLGTTDHAQRMEKTSEQVILILSVNILPYIGYYDGRVAQARETINVYTVSVGNLL